MKSTKTIYGSIMKCPLLICNTIKLRKGIDWDENGKTYQNIRKNKIVALYL